MSALLELRNVTKRFGGRAAVDGVSLALGAGRILGLLGPNGAGKTTLLRMCVGLLRPDGGEVLVLSGAPRAEALERVAYLPEERGLPPRPRVLDLLAYLGELKGLRRADARAQAASLLRRVRLDARVTSRVGELSKGNQQKVQIAAALMGHPSILLVDEPMSGLDPVNQQLVVELLQESAREGRAVLLSTHQLHQVEQLCDSLLLVDRGRELLSGDVAAVRGRFADGSLLVRGEADWASVRGVVRAVRQGDAFRLHLAPGTSAQDILREVVDRRLPLVALEPAVPSLEEIFVQLVSEAPVAEVIGA